MQGAANNFLMVLIHTVDRIYNSSTGRGKKEKKKRKEKKKKKKEEKKNAQRKDSKYTVLLSKTDSFLIVREIPSTGYMLYYLNRLNIN